MNRSNEPVRLSWHNLTDGAAAAGLDIAERTKPVRAPKKAKGAKAYLPRIPATSASVAGLRLPGIIRMIQEKARVNKRTVT